MRESVRPPFPLGSVQYREPSTNRRSKSVPWHVMCVDWKVEAPYLVGLFVPFPLLYPLMANIDTELPAPFRRASVPKRGGP